jgi:RNA polymerase sigma factor (sigma-70 family)
MNPGSNPSILENPENAIYETWKKADKVTRPSIEQKMVPLLYRHASKICWMVLHSSEPHLIEEIVEDALMDLSEFEGRSLFSTWFHSRAVFRCRNEMRRLIQRRETPFGDGSAAVFSMEAKQEISGAIAQMLGRLSTRERLLVKYHIDEGLNNREIGLKLDLNPKYVQYLWQKLRKKLRLMYGG